jgi:serine acetyltransferase
VFGTGGRGRETPWLAEQTGVAHEAAVSPDSEAHIDVPTINGLPVQTLESGTCDGWPCVIPISDPAARMRVASLCVARGMSPVTLVHPGVAAHKTTRIGDGAAIAVSTLLTINASIGDHVNVNITASTFRDVEIGEGSTLSPETRVAGHANIGKGVFIGVGATVVSGSPSRPITPGDAAFVTTGACVVADVASGIRMMGVAARAR